MKQFMIMLFILTLILPRPAISSAPSADDYPAAIAIQWFDLALELIRTTPGYSPPVAARALAYMGVTLYEAALIGMPDHQSLAGQLNDLDELPRPDPDADYDIPTVVNSAMAHITRLMFSSTRAENQQLIDQLETYPADLSPEIYQRSFAYGRQLADAIYFWSLGDGGEAGYLNNFPREYVPPVGEGLWVPTPPYFTPAQLPTWGNNRPFFLDSIETCQPPPPPEFSTNPDSQFYQEADEVYDTVRYLTLEQQAIALFWSDSPAMTSTPPGHDISIVSGVLRVEQANLSDAAEAYALVSLAGAEAMISVWYTKYVYNLIRPITYIQLYIDENWNKRTITDPVGTPPFPEYTSGHSVVSGAAMQVMTDLYGDDYAFTDITHVRRGMMPRSFHTFIEAAEEAGISRLYGGIHFRAAIENGLQQGYCIAEKLREIDILGVISD